MSGVPTGNPVPFTFYPHGGTLGQDLSITNAVDVGNGSAPLSYDCKDRTYIGHEGHDTIIPGFQEQSIGVPVFAALDGTVTATHDGEFDMNTTLGAMRPANFVEISHGGGQITRYLHLRRNSVAVAVGQVVSAGTQLGATGSSGNSTWPHLHFDASLNGIFYEPSAGPCRPGPSYWANQTDPPSQPSITTIAFSPSPFTGNNGYPFDQAVRTGTYVAGAATTNMRVQFALLPAAASYRIQYVRPDGTTALDFPGLFNNPSEIRGPWYYFQFNLTLNVPGIWRVRLLVNGALLVEAPLLVVTAGDAIVNRAPNPITVALDPPTPSANVVPFCRVSGPVLLRDPDYDLVRYRYRWDLDGVVIRDVISAGLADAVPKDALANGQTLTCSVTPSDGRLSGPTEHVSVLLGAPTMSIDRSALLFAGVNNGWSFTSQTESQIVRMTQTGPGAVTWTVTSDSPWLVVSPTSGSGTSALTVSTTFVAGLAATQAGSITIKLSGSANTAGPITVTLSSIPLGVSAPPFGSFDTPADGTSGVAGSIAVTGWALDDVEVRRVTVCRDASGGEVAPVDARCAGNAKIYIGDAVFVDGARTDVQAGYPALPLNSRGGWGYLMLTNFLPNLGNGTFTLRAYAFDADGHATPLGSKAVACDNAHSTRPFGAIDVPAQGAVVSGTIANGGWVLTQRPKDIPADSSTITTFIDGAPIGSLDPGRIARPDVTSLFSPSYDTTHAAGGRIIDTTAFANGVHTIFWIVSDTSGSSDGIGSRFFTISNGTVALVPPSGPSASSGNAMVIAAASQLNVPPAAARLTPAMLDGEVAAAPADSSAIQGRRGFDLGTALQTYTSSGGRVDVQAEELDRIELHLSATPDHQYTGYLRTPAGLRPLPVGASLNATTGEFTWMPGIGFYGEYDLAFVDWRGGRAVLRQAVRIILNAKGSNRVGPQTIIDVPGTRRVFRAGQPFHVGGWAADLDATASSGVDTVHVWAYPLDETGMALDPIFLGPAIYGSARPDVGAIYGDRFTHSGYGLRVNGLAPGAYDVAVFAFSTVSGDFTPARLVRVIVR